MTLPNPDRRRFLTRSTALAAALVARGARADDPAPRAEGTPTPGLTETSLSPHASVRSVGLGDVRWTGGFWADRFATCRASMVPNLGKVMEGTEPSQFYHNLKIAAGEA